jgi:RNA-directed DNA polymerase
VRALSVLSALSAGWSLKAGLSLHPAKTRVVRVSVQEGFDFLGYHFRQHRDDPKRVKVWPGDKSRARFREKLRPLTKRNSGHALEEIIRRVNVRLRGFLNYFYRSVATPLDELDRWVRARLRAILRRRRGGRGLGRGADYQRWPNAFFEREGLFSLAGALARILHPPRG